MDATSAPPTSTAPTTSAKPKPSPTPKITYPQDGPGTYTYATGTGPVLGTAGTLYKYRVAVEKGVSLKPNDFAALVDATLGDDRSWIGGKNVRLQRVAEGA